MTEAEKSIQDAKDYIQKTITALSNVVINECYGTDEYERGYRIGLHQALNELIEARARLKGD